MREGEGLEAFVVNWQRGSNLVAQKLGSMALPG
jgi:hypothetical protein